MLARLSFKKMSLLDLSLELNEDYSLIKQRSKAGKRSHLVRKDSRSFHEVPG